MGSNTQRPSGGKPGNGRSGIHRLQIVGKTGTEGEGGIESGHSAQTGIGREGRENPESERSKNKRLESDSEAERLVTEIKKRWHYPCPHKLADAVNGILSRLESD